MPDFSRRSIILGTAGIAAAGAGVTAAAGLQGSVEGQADVQAEQALTVTRVQVVSGGDQDASFERVSDDNTSFQAAVELNNGDKVRFDAQIRNNAVDDLDVQIEIASPDVIDIAVGNENAPTGGPGNDNDANVDDEKAQDKAIKTGEGTYIATISGSDNDNKEEINIAAELDDTADPGSYDIGVAINPLSTN